MCVVANREIAAGEEVLANYNYSLAKSVWTKMIILNRVPQFLLVLEKVPSEGS